ncbi:MAG TPA: zf-HC2 domain-containing protein [Anaerolineae bacterium]
MPEHAHCEDMLGVLSEYVDGEIDAGLCAEIDRHLAECGNCRIMVDTLRKTIILYREYGHEDVPVEAKDRLYKVLNLRTAERRTEIS